MRNLLGLLLLLTPILALACSNERPPTNTITPAATQPGPLDNVTNPMKQPTFGGSGNIPR